MKSRILWLLLSGTLGERRASQLLDFFDALLHCRGYYAEAMEYRVRFFSGFCIHCQMPYPVDANFCPNCGRRILSEEEILAEMEAEWAKEQEQIRVEESAAWAERWRELENKMVHH